MTRSNRAELDRLFETFRKTCPNPTRRDLMRWSAIATAAVATARFGSASAAPGGRTAAVVRFQDDIVTDASLTIPFDPYGQPVTLDPHRTVNWGPFWVMFPNVWGGLLRYDQNGAVEFDLAESSELSDDGETYTFRIKPDLTFASGNPVNADAFLFSWQRALDPSNLSPMADFMSLVEGYDDYIAGNSTDIGFEKIDDLTVAISLNDAYTFFPSMLASYVWSVVDPAVVEELGDDEFVLGGAGTGPWQFSDFDPATQLVMTPNPNHWDGNSPSLSELTWVFLTGPDAANAALEMFQANEAISADVPLSLLETVNGDESLSSQLVRIEPQGSVRAIGMDFNQEPFNDVRVRRAIARAIDRDVWANEIWEGTWAPGTAMLPPVLGTIANYTSPDGIGFDADDARSLLEAAGFPNGEGLPTITYFQPSEDSDSDKARAAALLSMITDNSGIEIVHDTSLTMQQIIDQTADNGGSQFDIVWWWNIYNTPHLLSVVGAPDAAAMSGVFNWNGELEPSGDFDPGAAATSFQDLVNEAEEEQDEAARNEQYAQAEQLLLENAVYVPLGYWVQMYVQNPALQGTRQGPWTGRLPVLFDKDVVLAQ
ncbi:MAG: peptide ABC transporter substrate-binding protein [Thermomicrobiales bacterium]|nr:peptide ABC transporter substrate-binding protein [Thermomicrobiales bacterium]MCO5222526.1 peptide ABC transporter substrate-binding protein [Thermomicrobiales bacterium]